MSTYKKLLVKQSPESQQRIKGKIEALRQEVVLSQLRKELGISQTELAQAMSQPSIVKMERPGNDPRLSTLKRYVSALGGELSINIKLPTGKRVAFHL
ncbi:helix-turn-helix domain-containing protein [Rosenbergiella epipactidis]|uniref:helix-turn-helix domain-containing protein n=1 Tax=Rosenbergiella epipactidis TaxID=1544694 RepID=UPI001F4D8A6B|nr:helix-turn-helix domain-containing protein [Rosenbergiella epipactidis]